MKIIIRNIKRNLAGNESIREKVFEKQTISIGREQDSDLSFDDLLVSLRHASLALDDQGNVFLDLVDDNSATVNGMFVSGRQNPVSINDIVRIGSYSLTVEEVIKSEKTVTIALEKIIVEEVEANHISSTDTFKLVSTLPSKRVLSWAFLSLIFIFFLAFPILSHLGQGSSIISKVPLASNVVWKSGPLSLGHKNLENDCKTCHMEPFSAVKDATCLSCHGRTNNHASADVLEVAGHSSGFFGTGLDEISQAFGRDPERCASCHVEHSGSSNILPRAEGLCTDCHEKLEETVPHAQLDNITSFGKDHPQFRPNVIVQPSFDSPQTERVSLDESPQGFSGLNFSHNLHLSNDGNVAAMADNLPKKFGFEDGVSCQNCHAAESGGALFQPVTMQENCSMCHSIVFDTDNGFDRTLRHGEPKDVIASMRDFYLVKTFTGTRNAGTTTNTSTRRRPGRAAETRRATLLSSASSQAEDLMAAKVRGIFSEGGSCYGCHTIIKPSNPASLDFKVMPVSLDDNFYSASTFSHKDHLLENTDCTSCHDVGSSTKSSDVMLPKIEVCQDCHLDYESYKTETNQKYGLFPSNCSTCHEYHGDSHAYGQVNYQDEPDQ